MTAAGDAPSPIGSLPYRRPRPVAAMSRTRAELLRGAVHVLAEQGLRRAAMQDIAAVAGVAKGTLYNHFRTKDDVVRALLAAELDRLAARANGRPVADALAVLADEVADHPVLARLRAGEPESLLRLLVPAAARWAELTDRLGRVLGVDPGAAELAARWLVGVALHPGSAALRSAHAGALAAVLTPAPVG